MRVLHLIPAKPYGGLQILVPQLAKDQVHEGADARVLAVYSEPRLFQELEANKIPYCYIKRSRGNPLSWIDLIRQINLIKPDIICFHNILLWTLVVMRIALRKKCPWVFHAHIYPPVRRTIKATITRFLLAHSIDAVVGVSNSVTHSFKQYLGSQINIYQTIYNGINLPPEISPIKGWPDFMGDISPGRPLIGMATRLAGNKGIKEFIDALDSIGRYLPEARFVLAGEGPLLAWAQDYAARSGLRDKLALPGFIRDMPHFWAALDFALFTCPREPFGLRIVEPQAAGIVVAGYRNGSGSDEIIIPGETGIMVPWGRQEELAREMAAVWSDADRYAQIARAARDRLQTHFSLRNMSTQSIELYEQLIG